jgi:hypothetical protein
MVYQGSKQVGQSHIERWCEIMANKIYAFDEPHCWGGNSHVTMTEEQIIKFMRENPQHHGRSDEDLIDEFIVINFAYLEENNG